MFFRNKIFIILFLFCFTYSFAQPLKLNGKAHPMARFGLNTEHLGSSKTRAVDSLDCELVGCWLRGPSFAVSIVDTIAYLGGYNYMKILNIKDSTNPVLIGEVRFPSGVAYDIVVKDNLAFVADPAEEGGLRIIDVFNPSSPAEIGFCETAGDAGAIWIQDTIAYIVDIYDDFGLRIINVSDPSDPVMVGSYDMWNTYDVCVIDTIAYVAGNDLLIINVSDPSSPDSICFYDDTLSSNCFERIYILDTLAYAAGYDFDKKGLFISVINIADPSSPVGIGSYDLNIAFPFNIGFIGEIYVQDNLAYIAAYTRVYKPDSCGLYIIDVSDPTSMNEIGNYLTGGGRAWGAYLKDNLAHVSCDADYYGDPEGLIIIDVSEPSSLTKIGEYDTGNRIEDVWIKDSFAYVANRGRGLNIINVSDPSSPYEVGFCDIHLYYSVDSYDPYYVYVQDTFAYVAEGDSGLFIINVSDPSLPTKSGFYNTPGGVDIVWVQDTLAYLVTDSLCILNVSDPSSLTEISFYNTPGNIGDVWVQDTLAYLAANNLLIIDISDPSSPTEIGNLPGTFREIFVKDTFAFACDAGYGNGLHIIDISDPSSPNETGFCSTPGGFNEGIWVNNNLAYVANADSGLRIIEVSDPSNPFEVGFYNLHYGGGLFPEAFDVYVQDSLIYIAYDRGGLYIIKYTGPYSGIEEPTIEKTTFSITSVSNTIKIDYSIVNEKEKVKIEIFNILGQVVACPVDEIKQRGNYTLNWSGKTGIYFVKMEMGGEVYKQKTLLLK